ncbi:MAG: UV DNA damage repair endonuclease UvsE [Nitrospirae bacterium]|nr:UV DNA damage repair endonuclease UvsE [Nitrospirota bacterium]
MKVGYPCINLSIECRSSRTFRLSSYSDDRFRNTVKGNLDCLMQILRYNADRGLLHFRITSDLIPFASNQVCALPWQRIFRTEFRSIGDLIKKHEMRISMHPDQFTLINSRDLGVFRRSVSELMYHAEVLDLLGLAGSAKIQIHVGGLYGDREKSIRRFLQRYERLPKKILRRLVIENDDRLSPVKDCLRIHRATGIPVVFDVLHYQCLNNGESLTEAFQNACSTWSDCDGLPIVDYSSQDSEKRKGAHAFSMDGRKFKKFISGTAGKDFDIMFEIKDKEKSALRARRILERNGYLI